jgi:hypothetical protein
VKLWFIPYARRGFRPSADGHSAAVPWRAQALVDTRLSAPGQASREAQVRFDLLGPGDVVTIDSAQVLRTLPVANTNRAEPEFFPAIEFDQPDLAWAYSPATAAGTRLMPWICLIVVEDQPGVTLQPGGRGQSPWILGLDAATAARELPDLSQAWAWAHVQVLCDTASQIENTLDTRPDRTLCRLLAPRRLLPQRPYVAAVVPVFLAGRIAGLGGDPEAGAAQTGVSYAWSASDLPAQLPAYLTWRFTTGEAGDVESMLRRLHPAPPSSVPPRPLVVRLAAADAPAVADWQPALRVLADESPGTGAGTAPAVITAGLRAALAPAAGQRPVVGPPYLGEPWITGRPLDPPSAWTSQLNLDPMARSAASLGADLVRDRQEEIVAAVWDQLAAPRDEDRQRSARQLAVVIENQVTRRLQAAPLAETSRVLGPVIARAQPGAASVGLRTAVGRRVSVKTWRVPGGTLAPPAAPAPSASTSGPVAGPPPDADPAAQLVLGDSSYRGRTFQPTLPAPLSEIVADRIRALLLPQLASIDPDSVLALQVDPGFVAAFLVGANQELVRELRWRGLPADPRSTPFRRFWNRTDGADDIPPVPAWSATAALSANTAPMAGGILLRSELVHRCPSLVIAAVPAVRAGSTRHPDPDPAHARPAVIRTILGEDLLYAGFASLSLTDLAGGQEDTGPPGWFIMLAENPADPRFGLDPPVVPAPPPVRGNLSWSNLGGDPGAAYAQLGTMPPIPGDGFDPATADGANVAYVTQQRPFRAFLHASVLTGTGST